jgi:hypothetical protein
VPHRLSIKGPPGPPMPQAVARRLPPAHAARPLSIAWNAYDMLWEEVRTQKGGRQVGASNHE